MANIRVRARALDMLGRQQIAGIPTAISELFKNAHDAYARRVEVDYYRPTGLFVLRDDGVGMTKRDFEERWLTLGTESKMGLGVGITPPPRDPDQPLRPIMGEKGIGRLAIAAIGPLVLVLTRARVPDDKDELVAALIHWGMFTLPGIDLSDIQIPLSTFAGGYLPSDEAIREMVAAIKSNLAALASRVPLSLSASITADLDRFNINPSAIAARLPPGPDLRGDGRGTHFMILPTEETLSDDIDGRAEDDIAPPLIKVLVGFTNTMTPGSAPPPIVAKFRDHQQDGLVTERIAGSAFFTTEEFATADHHISGEFDRFGQFRGQVQVYGSQPTNYIVPWTEAGGDPLLCGPFSIDFAYVQGEARATKLPPEDHARMVAKLNRIGGLYIYRDGIRILPYGNSDYDFLNIEQRRTKSASYYFFSYRRMFGVINVSKGHNPNLVEKAGREGFRENKAYRQLKRLLENFFVQLAADFFREGGLQAEAFTRTNAELERNHKLRQKRAQQVRVRREEFAGRLDEFFKLVNAREPELRCGVALKSVEERLDALTILDDSEAVSRKILDIEAEATAQLTALSARFKVTRPRGVGLTKQLQRDWEAYQNERVRLESAVFDPASMKLAELISASTAHLKVEINSRRRLDRALRDISDRERRKANSLQRQAREELEQVQERVLTLTKGGLNALETAVRETVSRFESTNISDLEDTTYEAFRASLETEITSIAEREANNLERLREQLRTVATQEGLEQPDVTEALEEELEELRTKEFASLQLAQVGMALGIVHHEFASTINAVRNGLRRLKPWADQNKKLGVLYAEMRNSFDHLDGYLTLFTPLDRRLQRREVRIVGSEIHKFLLDLFGDRLSRHKVQLDATSEFRDFVVVGFPSSFYPCFVNIVDNSIFWLGREPEGKRVITLDADDRSMIISDSGPGIRARDANAVFDSGFTRKPGGRGLGLYISRQVLSRIGYDLTLDDFREGCGATFRIAKRADAIEETTDTADGDAVAEN